MPGCSNQGCKVTDVLRCQWQTWCGQLSCVSGSNTSVFVSFLSRERWPMDMLWSPRSQNTGRRVFDTSNYFHNYDSYNVLYINSDYRSDCCCGQPCREGSLTMGRCHTSLTDNWFHFSEFENLSHYLRIWVGIKGNGWRNSHVWDVSVTHHRIILAVCLQKPLLKQWPWGDVTYHWLTTYCKDPCLASRN